MTSHCLTINFYGGRNHHLPNPKMLPNRSQLVKMARFTGVSGMSVQLDILILDDDK